MLSMKQLARIYPLWFPTLVNLAGTYSFVSDELKQLGVFLSLIFG